MSSAAPTRMCLVIPCWCETDRLDRFAERLFPALSAAALPVEVQIVDDGSPLPLAESLAHRCEQWRKQYAFVNPLHRLPVNIGKGGAIYAGWNRVVDPHIHWLGFCDADGSVDVEDLILLLRAALSEPNPVCFCASRHVPDAQARWGSWLRKRLSRGFAAWVRFNTRLTLSDSQCGAKLIPAETYRTIRNQLRESRFSFDPELLLLSSKAGAEIREVPVRWTFHPNGTLRLRQDGWSMFWAVLRLPRKRNPNRVG